MSWSGLQEDPGANSRHKAGEQPGRDTSPSQSAYIDALSLYIQFQHLKFTGYSSNPYRWHLISLERTEIKSSSPLHHSVLPVSLLLSCGRLSAWNMAVQYMIIWETSSLSIPSVQNTDVGLYSLIFSMSTHSTVPSASSSTGTSRGIRSREKSRNGEKLKEQQQINLCHTYIYFQN